MTIVNGLPPHLYVPSTFGRFWIPAKKNAGASLARVGVLGDSISQIFGASSHANSYVGRLTSALQTAYGDGGSGFLGGANTLTYGATGGGFGSYTAAQLGITLTGSWTSIQSGTVASSGGITTTGDGPGSCILYVNNGTTQTWTQTVRGTSVTVYYVNLGSDRSPSTGGTINWTIDGVAQTAINTQSGSTSFVASTTVSGLSSGSHTVVLSTSAAGGTVFVSILGVRGTNATGVVVDNYGRAGAGAFTWTPETNAYGNPAAWSGGQANPCDLLLVSLGVNDAHAETTDTVFSQNIRKILTQVRDIGTITSPATDVLFLLNHVGQSEQTTQPYYYHDYVTRIRGIAASYGAAVVDMWGYFRNSYSYAQNLSYFSNGLTGTGASGSDTVHPGDTGHQLIYNVLATVPGLL